MRCGCGSLTGPRAVQKLSSTQSILGSASCYYDVAVAPHGMIRMTARPSCEARGSNGGPRYIHPSSQARIVITVLLLCLSDQDGNRTRQDTDTQQEPVASNDNSFNKSPRKSRCDQSSPERGEQKHVQSGGIVTVDTPAQCQSQRQCK